MNSEHPEEFSNQPVRGQAAGESRDKDTTADRGASVEAARREATVVVRGESVGDEQRNLSPKDPPQKNSPENAREATVLVRGETVRGPEPTARKEPAPKDQEKSPPKEVSQAKVEMQSRLPALGDDADVGVEKKHVVVRDGKADLAFTGTLLASAAPSSAPRAQWQEYRIYETNGGKHVFSKVTRSVIADQQDTHEAEAFDPTPASVPSKILRSAHDLVHSRPMTWTDAAAAFFGYDPLAKALYRKLSGQFEEHIT